MAIEKVHERLIRSTSALERVPYAVIGGNPAAAWVAKVEEDAIRSTKDVNLLIRREDLARIIVSLDRVGFEFAQPVSIPCFVEKTDPSPKRGIHCIYAGEKIRGHDVHPAPTLDDTDRAKEGYRIIGFVPLLLMKLLAFRDRDRTHLRDMLELNMIRSEHESALPLDLRAKLEELKANPEERLG